MLNYFIIKMKRTNPYRSPGKGSPSPTKVLTQSSPTNSPILNPHYFCHYRNAMYMGGVKNFKKDGRGILIHDNGTSIVCHHHNDQLHGHNIFFAQHSLLSADFNKGKILEAVYRTDGFLAHLIFNRDEELDGKCKLLNFTNKTITYAIFRKGILVQKQEQQNYALINKVFDLGEFDSLIGKIHCRTLNYDIEKENHIQGQKYGNKLSVGYQKGGILNGLGFSLIFRGSHGGYNPDTHRNQDAFELKIIQRGYMQNTQLHGLGEKLFQNGNLYIGQFKNGIFNGKGVLYNTAKRNWVNGYFQNGNLLDLFDYNSQGGAKNYDKIVQSLHQKKVNWINNEVTLPSLGNFDTLIEQILSDAPTSTIKTLQQRKIDVLKRIQDNFFNASDGTSFKNIQQQFRTFQNQGPQKGQNIKHLVHTFIPQVATIVLKKENKVENVSKFTPNRKVGQDIRKSKIFDKSPSTDRYKRIQDISTSRARTSRTPDQKKRIFSQLNLTSQRSRLKRNSSDNHSPQNEIFRKQEQDRKNKQESGDSVLQISQSDISQQSKSPQNKVRSGNRSRSKIFKTGDELLEEASPKFIYTRMEQLPQTQRRRRIGLDDNI